MSELLVPLDTSREAAAVYVRAMKNLGPAGRLKLAFELSQQLTERLEVGVRLRHSEYDENQVRLARIRLQLGAKLFREAFPGVEIRP